MAKKRPRGEGHKTVDGLYRVRLTTERPDGTKKVLEFVAKTKKQAQAKREAYIAEHGRVLPSLGLTVNEALASWEAREWPALQPSTIRNYKRFKTAFSSMFGKDPIKDLRTPELYEWLKSIGREHKRTAVNYKSCVSTLMNHARTIGAVTSNPVEGLKLKLEESDYVVRIEGRHQLDKILALVENDENRLFFAFLADSGLRPWKEATHLTHENVGMKQDVYYVKVGDSKTKAGENRYVPLSDEIGRQLINREGLLFKSAEGCKINQSRVSTEWRRACRKAGIDPSPQPYSLRRYAITAWCEAGVSLEIAKVWAGHTDIRLITDVYNSVSKSRQLLGFEKKSERGSKGVVAKQIDALGGSL